MEKIDEDIIIRFMHEQKEEVKDNGFSHKVMRHLPKQHRWVNWIFNILCTALCLYLFYLLNGVEILYNTLKEYTLSFAQNFMENVNPMTLAIALGILIIVGISKACYLED